MLIAAEHLCKNYGLRQLLADVSVYVDSGDKIGIIGINGTGKSTLLRLLARAAEHLCKNYGLRQLLADVSVYVDSGDKIGIIGINGTGKSTLLRLLARAEEPDRGTVQLFPRVRAAYLPQNPAMDENAAVLEQVLRLLPDDAREAAEYEARAMLMRFGIADCTQRVGTLSGGQRKRAALAATLLQPDDAREAAEYEARAMLMRFGIADCTQRVGTLSGGQRKRAALAATLLQPADVLLLDEPTNHLDLEMVEWLEGYLRRFRGALVLITHDRYFLDRVVNRIVEVDHGALYSYEGGWSKYLELKAERLAMADASERKDRYFLDRVVNRIVEVDHGALYSYEGGWSKYLELKAERLAMADASERKRQSILRRRRFIQL